MTNRILAASGVAATALVAANPALAAQEMSYEQQTYEYAQPLPEEDADTVFVADPVIQPVPASAAHDTGYDAYAQPIEEDIGSDYVVVPVDDVQVGSGAPIGSVADSAYDDSIGTGEYDEDYGQVSYGGAYGAGYAGGEGGHVGGHHGGHVAHPAPVAYPQPAYRYDYPAPQSAPYPQAYPAGYPAQYPPTQYPPMPPVYDRGDWVDQCRGYLEERRRRGDRGGVIGSLLGAAAGGVAGNRIADGERLAGTLIGAGVGGLAGLAIGTAVGLASGDPDRRDCKRWLERYEDAYAAGHVGYGYGMGHAGPPVAGYGYNGGYAYGGGYAYSGAYVVAPMTTVVVNHGTAMVPVVRQIVTEEWVEEDVVQHRAVRHVQPAPVKRVRYVKQAPAKRVKYVKGK